MRWQDGKIHFTVSPEGQSGLTGGPGLNGLEQHCRKGGSLMRPIERQRTNSRSHQRAAYRYLPYGHRRQGARGAEPRRSAAQRATGMIVNRTRARARALENPQEKQMPQTEATSQPS